jgi:hypothetical protein
VGTGPLPGPPRSCLRPTARPGRPVGPGAGRHRPSSGRPAPPGQSPGWYGRTQGATAELLRSCAWITSCMPQTPPGSKPRSVTVIPRLVSLFQVSSLPWNRCPACRGITVHLGVESVSTLAWNTQGESEIGPGRGLGSERGCPHWPPGVRDIPRGSGVAGKKKTQPRPVGVWVVVVEYGTEPASILRGG